MADKFYIPVILGTIREGRASEAVAHFIHAKLAALPGVETKLIDIRTLDMPWTDEGPALAVRNQGFVDDIIRADGLLIVSPEYNHSFPGSLKRVLDICYKEYAQKAVGIVGVSSGMVGGARMIEHLSTVLRYLGLSLTKTDLLFPQAKNSFNEDGSPKDEKVHERCAGFLNELLFLAKALKWGRENVK